MESPHTDEFTSNPRYSETGLQTANRPDSSQPGATEQQTDGIDTADHNKREVTDPVTHLPISIHDATDKELERIPPPPASPQEQPEEETARREDSDRRHDAMNVLVEEETKRRWEDREETLRKGRVRAACVAGVATAVASEVMFLWALSVAGSEGIGFRAAEAFVGAVGCAMMGVATAVAVWIFTAAEPEEGSGFAGVVDHKEPPSKAQHKPPESAAWLNSLLSSLWPIINPALFNSLSDMLEDAMQASLPKLVKGVRVADFGQGNESVRILGIRWLEAGDAAEEKSGMLGEEGDFANFEIAVAYRSRPTDNSAGRALKKRSRNAHLLIEFWSVGGLRLPVWVEVTGFLATARVRMQLTPNPPFLRTAIITLLGQPKVNVSCVPIAKNFLNIMDIPVMNKFLQSSIDQAISNYVAPRSLTLDLKTLLTGAEKMDTDALGVLVVRVISAEGFKDGDGGKKWLSDAKKRGDPYVTVGWGKWGKGMWNTRIIQNEGLPVWDETDTMLVGQTEVDAEENLQLKLWDSDRSTADDLLGVVQVPLKELITNDATKNRSAAREDGFSEYDGKPCPGKLRWEVGYFEKAQLNEYLKKRKDTDVEATKREIEEEAERKLREAEGLDKTGEIEQQKAEDLKERTDEIISGSAPSDDYPSGILYIKIEQIQGLEIPKIRQSGVEQGAEDEEGEDLPSSYCTIIINHQKAYKTRTKLKDNKPFFDASTERFLRDWRSSTLIISVRDNREHEADPLLGVVVLPLHKTFATRSQLTASYPLVGGIGYGRLRLSLIFRSVYLQLPRLLTGWNTGTLEVFPHASGDLPSELQQCRLVFRTLYAKRKMLPTPSNPGEWNRKQRDRPIRLAVCRRYASCLLVQFRKYSIGPDTTAAWAVLWFREIVDDEEMEVELKVRKGEDMKRAVNNCLEVGEVVGALKLKLRFWPGLSGYHTSIASSDADMRDVMEVLEAAEDAREVDEYCSDVSTTSSSSSGSEHDDDGDDDGKRGFVDELREYKHRRKDLHRRHRGLMQFRAARKVAWIGHGMKERSHEIGEDVKARWNHRSGSPEGGKVETEV